MPRYFFHVHDGRDLPDEVGSELDSVDAARTEAFLIAGDIIRDGGSIALASGRAWMMTITDERGDGIFTMRFAVEDTMKRSAEAKISRSFC